MRARLALAVSGLKVVLREIVLRNKPEHMLQISPKGTVPVLLLADDTVIEESLDIVYWALNQADPLQLLPVDPDQLRTTKSLIKLNDGVFKHGLDRYKYPPRYTDEHDNLTLEQFSAHHRDAAAAALLVDLNLRLAQHSYLIGDQMTVADIAIAPFVRQYAHTNIDWFKNQDWPHLINWLQRFLESEHFAQVMHKYTPWQEEDQAIWFPPAMV